MNTNKNVAGRMLTWAAAQHRERNALIVHGRSYSFVEVEARTNRLANALIALGLQPGERFAVLLGNSVHCVDSIFGAEKAALTYLPLNARHTLHEHADILNDAEVAAVLIGPQFAAVGAQLAARVPSLKHVIALDWSAAGTTDYDSLVRAAADTAPAIQVGADHLIRIAYTSGTTGKPKGVAYTLERWQARLTNHFMAMEYALGHDDAMLHVGPLTHAAGIHLLPCYLRGTCNVIEDKFDAEVALKAIEQHRITQLMLVPTMLSRLLDVMDSGAKADVSSLRIIHYGTAPTSAALLKRAIAVFGPILRQQYGMTEAVQPLAVLYPDDHVAGGVVQERRLSSCGRPTVNVNIEVRDREGKSLPPDEIGEIAIAHRGVGEVRFWRRPELLAESVRSGWYYTGDLGHFDEDGYLYIVGRSKDMIISGGFNVYAREVEDALAAHGSVAEAAVLGLPDAEWGEKVAAFVVLRHGAAVTKEALLQHCGERIAGYKKPRVVDFVDALPRNASGKVTKNVLKDAFLSRTGPGSAPTTTDGTHPK